MQLHRLVIVVPSIALLAACGAQQPPADPSLSQDLALAAAQPARQQFVSPVEMGTAGYAPQTQRMAPHRVAAAPVARRTSSTAARAASAGDVYQAPAEVTVKHTGRDAAIGAVAGAAVGAAVGRDVKGAVIGAAAGGILGAVFGNNVDVQRRRAP